MLLQYTCDNCYCALAYDGLLKRNVICCTGWHWHSRFVLNLIWGVPPGNRVHSRNSEILWICQTNIRQKDQRNFWVTPGMTEHLKGTDKLHGKPREERDRKFNGEYHTFPALMRISVNIRLRQTCGVFSRKERGLSRIMSDEKGWVARASGWLIETSPGSSDGIMKSINQKCYHIA